MLKSDLAQLLAREGGLKPRQAEAVVASFFDRLVEALARGETVEIRGFGAFHVRRYDGYKGRDPRTRGEIEVGPRCGVQFRTGKELRERLNGAATADSHAPESTEGGQSSDERR